MYNLLKRHKIKAGSFSGKELGDGGNGLNLPTYSGGLLNPDLKIGNDSFISGVLTFFYRNFEISYSKNPGHPFSRDELMEFEMEAELVKNLIDIFWILEKKRQSDATLQKEIALGNVSELKFNLSDLEKTAKKKRKLREWREIYEKLLEFKRSWGIF